MVTKTITINCPYCKSNDVVKNGHAKNGKQQYKCKRCKKNSRENPENHGRAYGNETHEKVIKIVQERCSQRGASIITGISRTTIAKRTFR